MDRSRLRMNNNNSPSFKWSTLTWKLDKYRLLFELAQNPIASEREGKTEYNPSIKNVDSGCCHLPLSHSLCRLVLVFVINIKKTAFIISLIVLNFEIHLYLIRNSFDSFKYPEQIEYKYCRMQPRIMHGEPVAIELNRRWTENAP